MKKILLLLFCFLLVGCNSAKLSTIPVYSATEEIKIYVATDIHYFSSKLTDNGSVYQEFYETGDGKQLNYIETLVDVLVEEVLAAKPHVLIISGDLTLNGEKQSHIDLAEKLLPIREAGIHVLVIPGNHDINSPYAREFVNNEVYKTELVDPEVFRSIYKDFGYTDGSSYDQATLSYCMPISDKLWIVMIDAILYNTNTWFGVDSGGRLSSETLAWLETIFKEAAEKNITVLTVTHQNLFDHSSTLQEGYTLYNNQSLYKLMANYHVPLNLSGHVHIQHIESKEVEDFTVYDIVTSSLAVYTNQYGILKFTPDKEFSYRTNELDVESYANRHQLNDENLLQFENYSYDFYTTLTFNRFYKNSSDTNLSEEERVLLASTMATVNPHYFSGTIKDILAEVLESEYYQFWLEHKELRQYDYLQSMLKLPKHDPTEIVIPLE